MLDGEVRYYMWLVRALGIPSKSAPALLEEFKTAKAVYEADEAQIKSCSFLSKAEKARLLDKDLSPILRDLEYCEGQNVGILTYNDEKYPSSLRKIEAPPLLLYYRGRIPDWNALPMFAVVGTRTMTKNGAEIACDMAFDLGKMGAVTVSGMALGIDGVVSAATLEAGGITVAVLGSGIDYIYPIEHRLLYAEILRLGGLVITEYPPYEKPVSYHFPVRNRIISGLSQAVIVVEGDARSGALITAEHAKRQGKPIFAVPGSIKKKESEGPLLLLKSGAYPITCSDDIYDAFRPKYLPYLNGFTLTDGRKTTVSLLMDKYGLAARNPFRAYVPTKEDEESLSLDLVTQGVSSLVKRAVSSLKGTVRNKKRVEKTKPLPTKPQKTDLPSCWEQLTETEQKIYSFLLEKGGCIADDIKIEGVAISEVISSLINMEICGCVSSSPGGVYKPL
ncbi:MAG: DNA-processing protein DprA [Clostridia bacterium]|nr:DNA-processing protein DprA [Clostridia bacterium]